MIRRAPFLPILLLLAAGCASPGGRIIAPHLGYDAILEPAATYRTADTSRIEIDVAGETIESAVSTDAVLEFAFEPRDDRVAVTARYRRLSARATNPLGPEQTATEEQIEGLLVFSLDPVGTATVVSTPTVGGGAAQFVTPAATAATFFPRVPGREVARGDTWTDTVLVDADQGGGSVAGTSVVTYTIAGDTVISERYLVRVDLAGQDERVLSSDQADMAIRQSLAGTSTGWFLWDPALGLPYESVRDSELIGTMEVAEVPFPFSIRLRSRSESRIVEAESDD